MGGLQGEIDALNQARAFENLSQDGFAPRSLGVVFVATQGCRQFVGLFAELVVEASEFVDGGFQRRSFFYAVFVVFLDGALHALHVLFERLENLAEAHFVGLLEVVAVLLENIVGNDFEIFLGLLVQLGLAGFGFLNQFLGIVESGAQLRLLRFGLYDGLGLLGAFGGEVFDAIVQFLDSFVQQIDFLGFLGVLNAEFACFLQQVVFLRFQFFGFA